jgi:hypothetical protein
MTKQPNEVTIAIPTANRAASTTQRTRLLAPALVFDPVCLPSANRVVLGARFRHRQGGSSSGASGRACLGQLEA